MQLQDDRIKNEWHTIPTEQAIIGACILESDAISRVAHELQPQMFYELKHQILWKAMLALFNAGEPIDMIILKNKLSKEFAYQYIENVIDMGAKALNKAGGLMYLTELATMVANSANLEYHSKILIECWLKREYHKTLLNALSRISTEVQLDIFDEIAKFDTDIQELQNRTAADTGEISLITAKLGEDEQHKRDNPSEIPKLETGFIDLDKKVVMTTGMVVLLAARPSMGKSTLMLNIAKNMAKSKIPVAVFSLEMPKPKLAKRMALSDDLTIDTTFINQLDQMHPEHYVNYQTAIAKIGSLPIYMFGIECNSIIAIRAKLVGLKKKGVKVVFIDYLQLIKNPSKKNQLREQEVAEISRALAEMALQLDMLIIALSQLSRAVETRGGDKKPQMSDIRESGSIEQDCRVVLALYRPEYYGFETNEEGNSTKGLAQVLILKQNEGVTGSIDLDFIGNHFLFKNKGTSEAKDYFSSNNDPF